MLEKRWNIQCTVWGGVTGFRQSRLKGDGPGGLAEFTSHSAARIRADELARQANGPNAKANFAYRPIIAED